MTGWMKKAEDTGCGSSSAELGEIFSPNHANNGRSPDLRGEV